ncbi:hypothetical protein BGX21_000788 [Mortierella sp. AD011]|nr:hypothetical protein BGX20_000806 [Mortierella sp. AD010]KAF9386471.1 hypothetical protein BGX21_000788 [Mortierella sp. AD011]
MDVYSLTKKQRPTHLTRAEVDKTGAMALPDQQHSQLSQRQQQQQQQPTSLGAPPTLKDIETKHSQLPPQYRQAVLEQQQREHQQRILQQQQHGSPKVDSQRQSVSVSSTPNGNINANGTGNGAHKGVGNSTHPRNSSAPLLSSHRLDRSNSHSSTSCSGPSRAHWKPDSSTQVCTWPGCLREFGFFDRRHHCRKCGDIFCSAHCSKSIPLDQALDFNPAMGVMSRACTGCFEAYEQWQGLAPSTTTLGQPGSRGAFGFVSDSQTAGEYSTNLSSGMNKQTGSLSPIIGKKHAEGLSSEALGREDVVRLPKSTSENITIKTRPVQDTTVMPMPSVPHDWSWSTF